MIRAIQHLDNKTAAGILARAALSLENDLPNPDNQFAIANEADLRRNVLIELKNSLGLSHQDFNPTNIHTLYDALDLEVDKLLGKVDVQEALKRVSNRGSLPSDQFEITIIPNVEEFYGEHFAEEYPRIIETIKSPHKEQQFGEPKSENEPFLLSLFGRYYRSKYPGKDFLLLVAGQRMGLKLEVHLVWRIYPLIVPFNESDKLVTILEKFANVFGVVVTAGDKSGSFILSATVPEETTEESFSFEMLPDPKARITISAFSQINPITKQMNASLITGINLRKYIDSVKKMGWKIISPT